MKKQDKNTEMKIYEALGVKQFRKAAFCLYYAVGFLPILLSCKDINKTIDSLKNTPGNYNMKKGGGKQDLIDYKKWIMFNSTIHIACLLSAVYFFISAIKNGNVNSSIIQGGCIAVNAYCVMLQRYNTLRLNKVLKKMEKREERKKNIIKEEIKRKDKELDKHIYVEYENDKNITIDEIINNLSLEELKAMKERLYLIKNVNLDNYYFQVSENDDKNKTYCIKKENKNISK